MRVLLILTAAALSFFDGFLSQVAGMVFPMVEGSLLWYSTYPPLTLWIAALACFMVPRVGAVIYLLICFTCITLCCDPWRQSWHAAHWGQCIDNHRWSVIGGVLLIASAIIPKNEQKPRRTAMMNTS